MRRPRKFKLIAVLVVAVVGATAWLVLRNEGSDADFTATDFHGAYRDQMATTEPFIGRSISIRGAVESVKQTIMTPYRGQTVSLGSERQGVICNFGSARASQTDSLFVGQMVTIRGTCSGDFGGFPILEDCVIERAGSWPLSVGKFWDR